MKGHFFAANALDDEDAALDKLQGKMDVVYAGSFLHLFNWEDQLEICKRIIKTLKPVKGSLLFGRQTRNVKGRESENLPTVGGMVWRHDVESFKKLWDVAGSDTGTKWKKWGQLDHGKGMGASRWREEGGCWLTFEVERVE